MTRRDAEEALKHHYWRLQVLEKDHRTCRRCGTTEFPEAHHVEAWSQEPDLRYDPENGAVLCYECHKLYHKLHGLAGRDKLEEFVTLRKVHRKTNGGPRSHVLRKPFRLDKA